MSKQTKQGDRIFISGGMAADYVAAVEDGHVVRPVEIWGDEDEEYCRPCPPIVVDSFMTTPPLPKIEQAIVDATEKLAGIRGDISEAHAERRRMVEEQAATLKKLKALAPVLDRIEDVVEGRITHFIAFDYSGAEIHTFEDALKDGSGNRYDKELRLMTLYGKTDGDLSWNINRYSDGSSSSSQDVIPCTSEEDAKEKLTVCIDALLKKEKGRGDLYYAENAMKTADLAGLPFPDDIRGQIRADKIESRRKKVVKAQKDLDEKTAALDKLEQSQ